MDKSITVVVFYESHEIRDLMEEVLRGRASELVFSNLKEDQKEFIEFARGQHTAFMFIYAFEDPKFAIELYQLLDSHSALSNIMQYPHLSVLFCNREYREQAYRECMAKRFFLYDTINPVYDMNKVRLLLDLTSEALMQQIKVTELEQEIEDSRRDMFDVSLQLDGIEGSINDEKGIQGGLLDDLARDLNELGERHESLEGDETSGRMKQGLDEFKNHNEVYFSDLGAQVRSAKPKTKETEPLVIVADDQKMMLKIITTILQPKGFRVETASNGAEAIMKAKVFPPSAVLLDIDMPVMNGVETLKAFKKLEPLKHVPIIMLTSNTDKHSFVECLKLGAVDYIVKPTNAETLLKKLLAVV